MKDFYETKDLTGQELHQLLAEGDARDRLYAIWALALRSEATRTMIDQLHRELDAGVRRTLAVVLAAKGEVDLLVAMCRHDPSVHVRASVVQIVMRFAAAGRVPWSLVLERLSDAAEVRASVVGQLDASSPPELRATAVTLLRDDDEMVRREAFETCLKLVTARALGVDVLRDVLDGASPGECANALSAWFAVGPADVIGQVLASARREVRECALRMRPALARTELAPLLADDAELFVRLRHALRLELFEATLPVALGVALLERLDFWSVEHVSHRVAEVDRLTPEQMELLLKLAARCEAALTHDADLLERNGELARYDDEDARDDHAFHQHVYAHLVEQIARL